MWGEGDIYGRRFLWMGCAGMDGCCGFGGSRGGGGDTRIIARDNVVAVVVDEDRSYSRAEESEGRGEGCLLIAPFPVFPCPIHTLLHLLACVPLSPLLPKDNRADSLDSSQWACGGGFWAGSVVLSRFTLGSKSAFNHLTTMLTMPLR